MVEVEVAMLIWVCCYSEVAGLRLVAAVAVEREEDQNEGHLSMGKQSMEEVLEVVAIV